MWHIFYSTLIGFFFFLTAVSAITGYNLFATTEYKPILAQDYQTTTQPTRCHVKDNIVICKKFEVVTLLCETNTRHCSIK